MSQKTSDTYPVLLPELHEQFRDYALRVRNLCPTTVNGHRVYLERLFEYLGPRGSADELFAALDPDRLSAFLLDYARRYGPGSRQWMYRTIRCFLRFACDEEWMNRDLTPLVPVEHLGRFSRLPKAMPDSSIRLLEEGIDRSSTEGRRDAAMICLLSSYGVRGVQIRRLCVDHIDWKNERIRFPAVKGGRSVLQHLTNRAGNRLSDWLLNGRPATTRQEVFLDLKTAEPLNRPSSLSRVIDRRLREVGVPVPDGVSRSTHGFRHAFAVRMSARVPFKDLVDMLGHRDPLSTMIYARTDPQTLQEAALPWPGGCR